MAIENPNIHAKKLADIVSSSIDESGEPPRSLSEFSRMIMQHISETEKEDDASGQDQSGEGYEHHHRGHQEPEPAAPEPSYGIKITVDKVEVKEASHHDHAPADRPVARAPKELKKNVEGKSKKIDERTFEKMIEGLSGGKHEEKCLWLYRDMAKEYSLFMPRVSGKDRDYPISPRRWMTSEPPSELDLALSYSRSPILIPNVTTYRWEYEGRGKDRGNVKPDLLLVIDSSRSMPDPKEELSFPVLSAMIAARSALGVGNKVSVINFSKEYTRFEFSNQTSDIDSEIMRYHGDVTEIPGDEMIRTVKRNNYPIHTMIISDSQIQNLYEELDTLRKVYKESESGGTLLLCCEPTDKSRDMEDIGYTVLFARDFDELGRLTIDRSKELYGI